MHKHLYLKLGTFESEVLNNITSPKAYNAIKGDLPKSPLPMSVALILWLAIDLIQWGEQCSFENSIICKGILGGGPVVYGPRPIPICTATGRG